MNEILQQQIDYYRARASEYDEWFYRQGRYDRGEQLNQQWFDEVAQVRQALHQQKPMRSALELASGTGIWTQELLKLAQQITVVDASPEMIAIHRAKLQSPQITYIEADLFQWQPDQTYDFIFFGFWLSHVPPDELQPFLRKVASALKPDGHVFMVDSQRTIDSTAKDHVLPDEGITLERKLNDGRNYTIIKVFYQSDALQQAFADAGLNITVHETDSFFIYATGSKIAS